MNKILQVTKMPAGGEPPQQVIKTVKKVNITAGEKICSTNTALTAKQNFSSKVTTTTLKAKQQMATAVK